jgi:hypothetical protein
MPCMLIICYHFTFVLKGTQPSGLSFHCAKWDATQYSSLLLCQRGRNPVVFPCTCLMLISSYIYFHVHASFINYKHFTGWFSHLKSHKSCLILIIFYNSIQTYFNPYFHTHNLKTHKTSSSYLNILESIENTQTCIINILSARIKTSISFSISIKYIEHSIFLSE